MTKITVMGEFTYGAKRVYEEEKKMSEMIKNAKVLTDYENGIQLLKLADGGTIIHKKGEPKDRSMYGCAVKCEGELNEENLKEAKEKALEELFDIIREVANTIPEEFFVIKDAETWKDAYRNPILPQNKVPDEEIDAINYFTVGCKVELPNVYNDEEKSHD